MDGENKGKPYFWMDDLGGKPTIFGNIQLVIVIMEYNDSREILSFFLVALKPQSVTYANESS